MDQVQSMALDRLEALRSRQLESIGQLRMQRIQTVIDTSDANKLGKRLLEISDQIDEADAVLDAIDAATGDVKRHTIELRAEMMGAA